MSGTQLESQLWAGLRVYEVAGFGWHWEAGDFCSEDGHSSFDAALSDFEATLPDLLREAQLTESEAEWAEIRRAFDEVAARVEAY